MKECPKCHSQVEDTVKFCPECGNQFSQGTSGLATHGTESLEYSKEFTVGKHFGDDDALAFVYNSQYASSDGPDKAGVLVEDCEQYFGGIAHLIDQGAIKEKRYYNLRGFKTTSRGSYSAAEIIQQRINQARVTLKNTLDDMPSKFVLFFHQEVLGTEQVDGRSFESVVLTGYRDETLPNPGRHLCLLNDTKVKKLRDYLMTTLIRQGLAETPHAYGSKHVGGVVYSLTPEVLVFFDKYLVSTGKPLTKLLFDEALEAKHRIYHELSGRDYWDREALHRLSDIQVGDRADLIKVFIKLGQIGAIGADPGRLFVLKPDVVEYILQPFVIETQDVKKIAERTTTDLRTLAQNVQIGSAFTGLLRELGI
jgi:hypothetical protein